MTEGTIDLGELLRTQNYYQHTSDEMEHNPSINSVLNKNQDLSQQLKGKPLKMSDSMWSKMHQSQLHQSVGRFSDFIQKLSGR